MKTFKIYSNLMSVCITVLFIAALTLNLNAKPFAKVNNGITNVPVLSISEQLEKAKKEGKVVFMVITGTGATDVDKTITIANGANVKVPKSVVIQMNKDDVANSSLVTKLGVASVQLPFILVISLKGVTVAGFPAINATSDMLVKAIPSPKQDEVLFAVSQKRPVFIVISKKGLSDKSTILSNCKSASSKIASKPSVVEFDFNDSKESAFLKQIGITTINDKTITLVINSSGQIADKYEGIALESVLTASANKVIKSGGCCSGGNNKGCAPGATPGGCPKK